jgi:hypothetical protein
MPDALNHAQLRSDRFGRSLVQWCGALLLLSFSSANVLAQEPRANFDIPAQPLVDALVAFADKTGTTALIDRELAKGLLSSPVKGRLSRPDALRILLAGTGLSVIYASANAFTVGLSTSEPSISAARPRSGRRADYGVYFSQVQNTLEHALCRSINPEKYRTAFQLWIGESGRIQAVHFLGSTGDELRDAAITAVVTNASVAPPPQALPQPLTIVLKMTASTSVCAEPTRQSLHD